MTDKITMQNTEEYKKIYDSLTIDNDKIKRMQAAKIYYKAHPEERTERPKKTKQTKLDAYGFIKNYDAEFLKSAIDHIDNDNFKIDFKKQKLIKRRRPKTPKPTTEELAEE